jgi:CspA family cold shock protein
VIDSNCRPPRAALAVAVLLFSNGPCATLQCSRRGEDYQMPTGTIKKIVSDRGFGFIAAEDGVEYFFHRSGVESPTDFDSLQGGESVSFEIEASPKGPRANRVKLA